jgi:hypothetical protein
MLKQVVFESLTAHNFPAARFLKTLGGSFPTLEFGHSLPSVCLNLTQFMIVLLEAVKPQPLEQTIQLYSQHPIRLQSIFGVVKTINEVCK